MMKKFYLLPVLFLLLAFSPAYAQKIRKVEGTAMVRVERNMTLEGAQNKAKELAMINAIENTFGTFVEQQTDMTLENGKEAFNIIGTTKVKGEWVETMEISFEDNFRAEIGKYGKEQVRYVTCYIKGKAREIVPKANITFEVLNSPDPASRTVDFYDGEQLYLYFKSPVDGYLSVYLDDGDTAFCLLPDTNSPAEFASYVFVKGDKDYLFFSDEHNDLPQPEVEEYYLFTTKKIEYNTLYIIFSEDKFIKPFLKGIGERDTKTLPRSLPLEQFRKWLANQRATSTSFQDRRVKISIRPNKN